MQLIDTHCHIHSNDYPLDGKAVYQAAIAAGVTKLICVGTDVSDSRLAAQWALNYKNSWASAGVHPHEARKGLKGLENLLKDKQAAQKIVAIGETGLDYHYMHSSKTQQITAFEAQLQLSLDYNLPVIFHTRSSYEDFWPILSNFKSRGQRIRGVLHSFSDTEATLRKALGQELYIGVNGIATFTKDEKQIEMYKKVPLERILLETDAPYLTPVPHRGKVNEPAYVRVVAEYLASISSTGVSIETIAANSTRNATNLFHI